MLLRGCSAFLPDVIEGLGALLQPASRGVPRLDRLVQHIYWEIWDIIHLMLNIVTSDDVVDIWLYSWLTFLSWNNHSILGARGFLAGEEPWRTSPGVSYRHLLLQNYQNYWKVVDDTDSICGTPAKTFLFLQSPKVMKRFPLIHHPALAILSLCTKPLAHRVIFLKLYDMEGLTTEESIGRIY